MKLSEADIDRAIADNFGPSRFRAVEAERLQYRRADVIPLRSCMWAGNDEAGDLSQPRTFGNEETKREHLTSECPDEPEGRHVPPNTVARWATVIVGAAVAIPAFLALVWLGQRVAAHFPH